MRIVYFLSAMPGQGKSTFIRNNELEAHTISLDSLRHVYAGTATDMFGNLVLSNNKEDFVFGKFMEALKIRLSTGGVLFIDNLNQDQKAIESYMELLNQFEYDYRIIKFPLMDKDFYYKRNEERELYKRLPKEAIDRHYELFLNSKFDHPEKIITPEKAISDIKISADDLLVDLSNYSKINWIGDLQGSFYPLKKFFETEGGYKKDEVYIFVGDYTDRGIENDKCFHFVNKYVDYENFLFIPGNHEKHWFNHGKDILRPPSEFTFNTLPQLQRAGITKEDMVNLYKKLHPVSFVHYRGSNIMTTHAGLATVPKYPRLLSIDEYMKGYGAYSFNVDGAFNEQNLDNNWYQVHGHRNQFKLGFESYPKSFALEADVEYGGSLPILRLNKKGFNGIYITNKFFNRQAVERIEKDNNMFTVKADEHSLSNFLESKVNYSKTALEIVSDLRSNSLIREKTFDDLPHISAFNFKKEAFFDKRFDDELVIHARGLFVNTETGEIVARGFEKFFNVNERGIPSSTMENVKANFKGKITLYEKENGFLGIVGYDSQKDQLIFASKSDIGGEFSTYLKNIAENQFSKAELQHLKIFANKHNVSYLFEVNDPINDPHIIKYDNPHLVLIGVVKRDFKFSQMNYEALVKFSEDFKDLKVKKRFAHFDSPENFEKFFYAVSRESAFTTKKQLEGYVCEDTNLNMIKIKLPYYSFWKCMRGFVEKIERSEVSNKFFDIENGVNTHFLINDLDKPIAIQFLNHYKGLDKDQRNKDIITLRDEFLNDNPDIVKELSAKQKSKPKI